MATVKAKAFRITDNTREFLQSFIVEPIPEDTKYVLASPEGYLFFNDEVGAYDPTAGGFRIPRMMILSYYDIEYESE